MKQVIYTVYEMYERVSPTGQPYIGSTVNIEERRRQWRRQLGLAQKPILHILAQFTDDDEVFEYENALRVANGWKREHNPHFRKMLSRPEIRELRSINMKSVGEAQGPKNRDSGHLENIRSLINLSELNKEILTCPHCGKSMILPNLRRWHGEKCKHKPQSKISPNHE